MISACFDWIVNRRRRSLIVIVVASVRLGQKGGIDATVERDEGSAAGGEGSGARRSALHVSLRSASPTSPTPRAVAAVFTAAGDLAGFVEADLTAFAGGGLGRRPGDRLPETVAKMSARKM